MKTRPWTVNDNLTLIQLFKDKATQRAMAQRLRRSKYTIVQQLKVLGLKEVVDKDPAWTQMRFDDYEPAKSVGKRIYISCR